MSSPVTPTLTEEMEHIWRAVIGWAREGFAARGGLPPHVLWDQPGMDCFGFMPIPLVPAWKQIAAAAIGVQIDSGAPLVVMVSEAWKLSCNRNNPEQVAEVERLRDEGGDLSKHERRREILMLNGAFYGPPERQVISEIEIIRDEGKVWLADEEATKVLDPLNTEMGAHGRMMPTYQRRLEA